MRKLLEGMTLWISENKTVDMKNIIVDLKCSFQLGRIEFRIAVIHIQTAIKC